MNTTNEPDSGKASKKREQVLAELRALRETARLHLRLASMEARERWQQAEDKLNELEAGLYRDGEQVTEAVIAKLRKVTSAVQSVVGGRVLDDEPLERPVTAIMTVDVSSCSPSDSLGRAAQLMWERDCGMVPVVDETGRLCGLLSDRDVCFACYTEDAPPSSLSANVAMSKKVDACGVDASIEDVLLIMTDKRVRRVPVVDAEKRLLGVVALADVARFVQSLPGDRQSRALHLQTRALGVISEPRPRPRRSPRTARSTMEANA